MRRYQIPEKIEPADNTSGERLGTIEIKRVPYSYSRLIANLPPPDPALEAQLRLIMDTTIRYNSAMMFGVPITMERAREEALAALSDKDRALIAKDVTA